MARARRPRRPAAGAATAAAKAARPGKAVKGKPGQADNSTGDRAGGFALSELRRLIRLVQRTGIGELEVSTGGRTVRIAAHGTVVPAPPQAPPAAPVAPAGAAPGAAAPSAPAAAGGTGKELAVTSPMVGTFYRAPAPDADPYVEVGDTIEVGQTVCIVEAMKLMNEIESEVKGRVVKILVENAQPVEYGQKLFLIEP
jgi:acetyl-CoA carboxylase biotin carboxyl carrier protein